MHTCTRALTYTNAAAVLTKQGEAPITTEGRGTSYSATPLHSKCLFAPILMLRMLNVCFIHMCNPKKKTQLFQISILTYLPVDVKVRFHILLSLKIFFFCKLKPFLSNPKPPQKPSVLPLLFNPLSPSSPLYGLSLLLSVFVAELFTWLAPRFE